MKKPKILIIEDNASHLKILQYVLKRNNVDADFYFAVDGQEALDILFRTDIFIHRTEIPTPDLILLDLNLPRCDGREVLRILKADKKLKEIPVIIVSTSDREDDVNYAFQTGAAGYISKSSGFENFNQQISQITKFAKNI